MIQRAIPTFPEGAHVTSLSIIEDKGGYTVIAKVLTERPKAKASGPKAPTQRRQSRGPGPADTVRAEEALVFIQGNGGETSGKELKEHFRWSHSQVSAATSILREKHAIRLAGKDAATNSHRYVLIGAMNGAAPDA